MRAYVDTTVRVGHCDALLQVLYMIDLLPRENLGVTPDYIVEELRDIMAIKKRRIISGPALIDSLHPQKQV